MKIYGYARISTARQNLQRQLKNISERFPTAEIVTEVYTGTKSDRPAWNKLLAKVQTGDTIVFDSVSRMSRNADEGIQQYFELYEKGVNLVFLKEPTVNTDVYQQSVQEQLDNIQTTGDTAADNLISGIMKAIQEYQRTLAEKQIRISFEQAQKEVDDLRQRTKEGMTDEVKAKISRTKTGQKNITEKHLINSVAILRNCKEFGGEMKDIEVAEMLKIKRMTVYRIKRELQSRIETEQLTKEELLKRLEAELKKKKQEKKSKSFE